MPGVYPVLREDRAFHLAGGRADEILALGQEASAALALAATLEAANLLEAGIVG